MKDLVENKISAEEQTIIDAKDFPRFLNRIIHDWLRTLTLLVIILVPLFFILDYFIVPRHLLQKVGVYRIVTTIIVFLQFLVILKTKPSKFSYIHGYLASIVAGGCIVLMTNDLGGFNSRYYAGLNLVIIGVNLLLPWRAVHSFLNSFIIIFMYVFINLYSGKPYQLDLFINNLFFLTATAVIAVSINTVKYLLTEKEFYLMCELKLARDSIWSEMELAKRIQTALLPHNQNIKGFQIAATMLPAKEVGGDYYDIIETPNRFSWVTIGDVSGHGVDSGLIMMMAQTSILSKVDTEGDCLPSEMLSSVNTIIRENISRLGSDHYMTMMALRIDESTITVAGKHQDVVVYRSALNRTESISVPGTWLGITDDIKGSLTDSSFEMHKGDIAVLFTDGVTEATDAAGEMFSQIRLEQALNKYADLPVGKLRNKIIQEVQDFQKEQLDDITVVVLKK